MRGFPFCPASPAYSLISRDYGKLAFLMKLLTPVWCSPTMPKIRRRALPNVPVGTEIAASHGEAPGRKVTMLSELLSTSEHPGLDAAHDAIGPDTIAKFR